MWIWATVLLDMALVLGVPHASAQTEVQKLTLRNGESVEIEAVYWTVNCQSTMIGLPEVEVLEGPPGTALRIKEEPVLAVRSKCPAKVPGGKLMLTVGGLTGPAEAKLTYRVKYKTF